ncbi:MAG TPA: RDD family protein [Steroidobacteraceae bacterium]|nr:RDD family protein [Steroidobacteraceae bacterium]
MTSQTPSSGEQPAVVSFRSSHSDTETIRSAGFLRRVAAMVYDLFPVLALAFIVTMPFLPFLHGRRFIPEEVGMLAYVHWAIVLLVSGLFFVFFWLRSGQTLGMVAWRLRMQKADGSRIHWCQAVMRVLIVGALWTPFFVGYPLIWGHWADAFMCKLATALSLMPLLLAYAWLWIDKEKLAWPDRWTGTRVVVLPKKKK